MRTAEASLDWSHYAEYHRKFGEIVRVLGNGELTAVENGQAGIRPELGRKMIAKEPSPTSACSMGTTTPGSNRQRPTSAIFNTGMGGAGDQMEGLFSDTLRDLSRAANEGSRRRQAWLTEFGWDTAAGKIVTEEQQAAYLARGFHGRGGGWDRQVILVL